MEKIKKIKNSKIKLPRVGDKIYMDTWLFLNHGADDFIGGICTVSKVSNGCVEVVEDPGSQYSWEQLSKQQEKLRKEFGDQKGHKRPDNRPEFNRIGD